MSIQGRKPRCVLKVIGDAEAEFAYKSGRVAANVVVAGLFQVGGRGLEEGGILEVAVFVVGGKGGIGKVLARIS